HMTSLPDGGELLHKIESFDPGALSEPPNCSGRDSSRPRGLKSAPHSWPSGRLRVDRLALLHVEEEQPDADADGRVGHVERGPVVGLAAPVHVDVEEIDDAAEAEAVDEVADGAAEDQVEAHLQRPVGHG